MTTEANKLDREQWLTEAANMILEDHIEPALLPAETIDRPFKVSVGFPSGKPSKVIAECWKAEASASGHNEIFVSPVLSDSLQVLGALTHELVHYADNLASGHKNFFARVARDVGLVGKLTECMPSDRLNGELQEIIDILGPLPHAAIDLSKTGKKKQGTRMIKVECTEKDCQFTFRATKTQLVKLGDITEACCPACDCQSLKTA